MLSKGDIYLNRDEELMDTPISVLPEADLNDERCYHPQKMYRLSTLQHLLSNNPLQNGPIYSAARQKQ